MSDKTSPEVIHEIGQALEAGQKIQAIKLYREATGADLMAAKEFVESLQAKLIEEDPERFAKLAEAQSGCGTAVLLFAALGMGALATGIKFLV